MLAFRFDDAYITVRYAQQLARDGVLSFNPDDRIDGYTSVGWTLLLALCERVGLDGAAWMSTLSRLFGGLAIVAGMAVARTLGASWALTIAVAALGPLFTPGFVVWSVPGMEMPLAACCYAAALAAMLGQTTRTRQTRAGVQLRAFLLMAAFLVRPEGALLAGMLAAVDVLLLWHEHRAAPIAAKCRVLAPYLAVGLVLTAWSTWRWGFYGHPLPNTFYAKAPTPGLIQRGVEDAEAFLRLRAIWLTPIAALVTLVLSSLGSTPRAGGRTGGSLRTRLVLVVFAAWFCSVFVVYARSGGDFPGFHRFYQPLVPVSYGVIAAAISRAARGLVGKLAGSYRWPPHVADVVVAAACGTFLVASDRDALSTAFAHDVGLIRGQTDAVNEWERAGTALRAAWDRESREPMRMAVRAAGVLPHAARADRVYDTLALNNPDVAHHNPPVRDVPAHQKEATEAQILAWSPNVIVGHPVTAGVDMTGAPPAWCDSAAFRQAGYRFRCVPMNGGGFFCFWQRTEP